MNIAKIKGWLGAVPLEMDGAEFVVLSSTGVPYPSPGIALAQRPSDGKLIFAALGPNQRICGEWEPIAALDERAWAAMPIQERQPHAGLMMYMRGFVYGASGSAYTVEQMADGDWRRGWEAGRAAKTAAYVEGCALYDTELNVLRERSKEEGA